MLKYFLVPAVAGVLVGCGGGSSSPDKTQVDPGVPLSGAYKVEQLTPVISFDTRTDSMMSQTTQYDLVAVLIFGQDPRRSMQLSGDDRLVLFVDGIEYQGTQVNSLLNYTRFESLPVSGQEYSFRWQRGDELIESVTVDMMAEPIDMQLNYNGEDLEYSWVVKANHEYRYVAPSLNCSKGDVNETVFYKNGGDNPLRTDSDGVVSFSLSNDYGASENELRNKYDSCNVFADLFANRTNVNINKTLERTQVEVKSSVLKFKALF